MVNQAIKDQTILTHLENLSNDSRTSFLLDKGNIRGMIIHSTRLVNEMRVNHNLGILETLVLGHAYTGIGLMTMNIKGNDRIGFNIGCSGPIKGLSVETNTRGEIRGYLEKTPIEIEKPLESFDLSPFFGVGILTVTKYLESSKSPFSGNIDLQYGNIAQDLANYYLTSEQTPTLLDLSVHFNKEGKVHGSGGIFLQALPGANEKNIDKIEDKVKNMPSLGTLFSQGLSNEQIINEQFADFETDIMETQKASFFCSCNSARFESFLSSMKKEQLKDILDNGPFPVVTTCWNCNTNYTYDKSTILQMYNNKVGN